MHRYVTLSLLNNINKMSQKKYVFTKTHLFKYFENVTAKMKIFRLNYVIFHISAQKHRLWVLVRTALMRRFSRIPTIYVFEQNKKKMYIPVNPVLLYKSGVQGGQNYKGVFSWWKSPGNNTIAIQTFPMPGGANVSCILHHRGVQLILAYSWARPAILVAGKGRGRNVLFLLFLHFHSCSSFFPVPLFHLFCDLFYLFSPFLWETTQNDPQGLTCR